MRGQKPLPTSLDIWFYKAMVYAFLLALWLVNTFIASRLIAATAQLAFTSAAAVFYRLNKRPDRGSKEAGRTAGELVARTSPAMAVAGLAGLAMTFLEVWLYKAL